MSDKQVKRLRGNHKKDSRNRKDDLSYENEAYLDKIPHEIPMENGFSPRDVVSAHSVGTKWNHLVKEKRMSRQSSFKQIEQTAGLDDDTESQSSKKHGDPKKSQLNKSLISHFVKLAKNNDNNDQVDLDFVEDLLKKGADINCGDKYGQGLLHEAARIWHTDIVVFLVQHGADVNKTDNYGRTALHIAAAVDYREMVEVLFQNGANIESRTNEESQTPLHFAARNDAVNSLKTLIKLGAEIEATDYKGRTPIFVAAELDRSETAKFLVDLDADVSVVDTSGQVCMTHMITKMGPVAKTALDQFHRKDRANRRQYYYLNLLEVPEKTEDEKRPLLAKTPLEVVVKYRQLDLIMHPVITRLIDVKWEQFGRRVAVRTLLFNLIFVLIWTILGVGYPWQYRYYYAFPQDWWRVFLLLLGCLITVYYVLAEIREIVKSRKKFAKWKQWREKLIHKDMEFCHPKWPEEKRYLKREIDTLDDMIPYYFQDFWNYFDWAVYFLIFVLVLLHIIDVSLTDRVPVCCVNSAPCTNASVKICNEGFVNNANLSVWSNRIFVLTIIFLWLRLMKFTRAFRFFGPFIVMLGKMSYDILRFLYLYLEFFIPYSCAFWMIFGGVDTISTMFTVDNTMFSLFRITLVDEYQFPEMQAYDIVMAYLLIGSFLGISAILCLNLFIALLSDTFQRVYDNANANAVMQQAALILSFEEYLSKGSKKKFRKHIDEKCSPESLYYDDDLTIAQDADLKKVTIKIKEQMDELLDYVHQAETDMRMTFHPHTPTDEGGLHTNLRKSVGEDDYSLPRGGRFNRKSSVRFKDVLGLSTTSPVDTLQAGGVTNDLLKKIVTKTTELTSRMQRLQVSQSAQEDSYRRLRGDMKELRGMLSVILPGGGQIATDSEEKDWTSPPFSGRNLFHLQPYSMTTTDGKLSGSRPPPSQESKMGESEVFRNILGGNKQKTPPSQTDFPQSAPIFVSPSTNQEDVDGVLPSVSPNVGVELLNLPGSIAHDAFPTAWISANRGEPQDQDTSEV